MLTAVSVTATAGVVAARLHHLGGVAAANIGLTALSRVHARATAGSRLHGDHGLGDLSGGRDR